MAGLLILLCLGFASPRQRQAPENPIAQAPVHSITPALAGASRETQPQPEQTEPEETQPEQTEPEETKPEETQPEPEQSKSPTLELPKPTQPDPTVPTAGAQTQAPGEEPGGQEPDHQQPNGQQPGDQQPDDQEPGGDPDHQEPPPTAPEDSDPVIDTDLAELAKDPLLRSELEDDILPFYARLKGGSSELYLRVHLRNSANGSGVYLTGSDGNYQTALALGRNIFTIFIKNGSQTVSSAVFAIDYQEKKADEQNPVVGEHPPTIVTNLDGLTEPIKTSRFSLRVTAKDGQGNPLYRSNVRVQMDGKTIYQPTGGTTLEYTLAFPIPTSEEDANHTVTVLAWTDEGSSRLATYQVKYQFVDDGQVNGHVRVILDVTTLGLGWIFEEAMDIRQGQPVAHAVLEALENQGFTAEYTGTADLNFYLRRICGGDIAAGAEIPQNLWEKIQADGITITGQQDRDSLGEQDYTKGSGWLYSINGVYYPGVSLSSYMPSDGDTIYLRFTLAYGKDVGSSSGYGALSSYCGSWINETYLEDHSYDGGAVLEQATCTEPEVFGYTCTVPGCGHQKTELRGEALGHDEVQTAQVEATSTAEGYVEFTCSRCGSVRREVLPMLPPDPSVPTEPDPTDPQPPEPDAGG